LGQGTNGININYSNRWCS